jgi:hypothetical protein
MILLFFGNRKTAIPVTGHGSGIKEIKSNSRDLRLVSSLQADNPKDSQNLSVTGITLPGIFSYSIVNQPQGQPGFVSSAPNTLTKFQLVERYRSIGLLAHNYLAGDQFYGINIGDILTLEMNNGATRKYRVIAIKQYQALSPYSPYSEFINLSSGDSITASALFTEIYGSQGKLVLQTCIERNGVEAWGRYFVISEPVPYLVGNRPGHLLMSLN